MVVKIYALISGQLILYVGQTKNPERREQYHHRNSNKCASRYIPKWCDWKLVILEEVPDDNALIKEQYYYDTLNPLYNRKRPGQTQREYRLTEKGQQQIKDYNKRKSQKKST